MKDEFFCNNCRRYKSMKSFGGILLGKNLCGSCLITANEKIKNGTFGKERKQRQKLNVNKSMKYLEFVIHENERTYA